MDRLVIGILVIMAILTSIVFITIYSTSEEKRETTPFIVVVASLKGEQLQ